MLTASSVFLKTLADAGITHAFANWGSDHPAMLEELERLRLEAEAKGGKMPVEVVTSPNEMVALCAAQGYAQATGKPAAVIIHVDVGTQSLGGALHNVDRSRTPVLIYAGASPFSTEGEQKGSRNEWIMWLQDIPDQSAIVRQYTRFTAQMHSGRTIPNVVRRGLQIATSDPKGPVYLWARREVMEEEIPPQVLEENFGLSRWPAIEPAALSPTAATEIASALLNAASPLIITSFLGRNTNAVPQLAQLTSSLAIPVISTCPSAINIPPNSHQNLGVTYLAKGTHTSHLATADVILVIDCDLPWVPGNDKPQPGARVFVIDSGDPLKANVGYWHVGAESICRADGETALRQINEILVKRVVDVSESVAAAARVQDRRQLLQFEFEAGQKALYEAETTFPNPSSTSASALGSDTVSLFTVPNLLGILRDTIASFSLGASTLILNESISNFPACWTHMKASVPGSMITSGGSSLGWSLGAAVGASLGSAAEGKKWDLIVVIVGDGSFVFGVPEAAYWMARKYNTPFLTIVLNNGGWKSPKLSMLGVHPTGLGSKASGARLSTGFGPDCPNYSQVAVAASGGWAWGRRIGGELKKDIQPSTSYKLILQESIQEAIQTVVQEKRCAVLDCVLAAF